MILVTGGTGLLGSHLLYALVKEGKAVRAIKREFSNPAEVKKIFGYYEKSPQSLFDKIEWVDADILIPESLDDVFSGISRVFHAAAFVSFDPKDKQEIIKNNVEGTFNIVNCCLEHGIEKLIHVSSTAALGPAAEGEEVSEKMMWIPDKFNSAYSVSKFKSEMEIWRGIEEGLHAVIVNPSVIIGPGFWHKGSSSMFPVIKKGLRYYTEGITGYVGVEDVVKAMIFLMDSRIASERFILSSENLSYRQVFELIAKSLHVKAPRIKATPFLAGVAWRMDALRSLFGGKRVITKEAVAAGNKQSFYSNKKIREVTGSSFEKIETVIMKTGGFYRNS